MRVTCSWVCWGRKRNAATAACVVQAAHFQWCSRILLLLFLPLTSTIKGAANLLFLISLFVCLSASSAAEHCRIPFLPIWNSWCKQSTHADKWWFAFDANLHLCVAGERERERKRLLFYPWNSFSSSFRSILSLKLKRSFFFLLSKQPFAIYHQSGRAAWLTNGANVWRRKMLGKQGELGVIRTRKKDN